MSFDVHGEEIESVGIIDDQPDVREVYTDPVEDLEAIPVAYEGPLPANIDTLIQDVKLKCQAVLCDFRLRISSYANYDGHEIVAALVREGIPAILCTEYRTCIDEMRPYRRYIPALLSPGEVDLEAIVESLHKCLDEINGVFEPSRRAWRTMARFQEVDGSSAYFVLPAWRAREGLRIALADLPEWLRLLLAKDPDVRCHVWSNIGAASADDIFVDSWMPAVAK